MNHTMLRWHLVAVIMLCCLAIGVSNNPVDSFIAGVAGYFGSLLVLVSLEFVYNRYLNPHRKQK